MDPTMIHPVISVLVKMVLLVLETSSNFGVVTILLLAKANKKILLLSLVRLSQTNI